ncbi:MAG: RNA polymerase subunit sigma [Planctomycetota bacterium]|nr:MAG: RNA polymerase subunit sigma [Planctomycetota bacterium]
MSDDAKSEQLLRAAQSGDREAIDALFERHRARLRRMVELRLNRKLWGRVDPSDVVQEAMLQGARRVGEFVRDPQIPAYLWLRTLTQQQLLAVHRFHLGTGKRDANLEVTVGAGNLGASSASLASLAVADATSPSGVAAKAEQIRLLEELIDAMPDVDREILALRHFEQMSNSEAARVLEIGETAASQRFLRALQRLRQRMQELGLE